MSNFYEPDPSIERKVVRGLIQVGEFARRYREKKVAKEIFESEAGPYLQRIADHAVEYFGNYGQTIPVKILIEKTAAEEQEKGNKEGDLVLLKTKQVIAEVLAEEVRPQDLPYLLDDLIERHRRWRTLVNAKEVAVRFFTCKLDHGKHELCKGCPVWSNCKYLQDNERGFSEKVWFLQDIMRENVLRATGGNQLDRGTTSAGIRKSLDRLKERKKVRDAGGEGFTFGIPTPWPTVTRITDGWKRGELYGIFAERKTGKTISLLMTGGEGARSKVGIQVFAMEDDKEKWLDKFFCQQAGCEWEEFLKGTISDTDLERIHAIADQYEKGWTEKTIGEIYQFHRPIGQISLDDIKAELDLRKSQGEDVGLVLIDHIHIMRKPWTKEITRDDLRLNHIVETLKSYAQTYNCAIVAAAQLKTSGERKGHTRGSDQLEDAFDAAWHLVREKGVLKLKAVWARNFANFEIELMNLRNKLLLPEAQDMASTVDDFDVPSNEWLGGGKD